MLNQVNNAIMIKVSSVLVWSYDNLFNCVDLIICVAGDHDQLPSVAVLKLPHPPGVTTGTGYYHDSRGER